MDDGILNTHKMDDTMRALIMEYINAHNAGNYAKAEELLHNINTLRKMQ
jgi:hypothetical protein